MKKNIINKMIKVIVNIMATTGTALVLEAAICAMYGVTAIYVRDCFQVLGANIVIHLGLLLTGKFESRYAILEFLLDLTFIIVVVAAFGAIFNWASPWIFAIAVVIYVFGILTNMARIRKDADEINELLNKRKEKNIDTAS
jgi:hypothetical protein